MTRHRPITVERRAIPDRASRGRSQPAARASADGFDRLMSIFSTSQAVAKIDMASRPLAAEVERMLRRGPIRFPEELM
jgi:hypothetical protein